MFGELLGIWTITEWMAQGRPSGGVHLIEVGPGKGTLMADLLRVSRSIPMSWYPNEIPDDISQLHAVHSAF